MIPCIILFLLPLVFSPVLGLVPALVLTPHPTETTPAGTIRTTEVGSGATTEATGGLTTTVAETEAITNVVIIRTGEEVAMAINQIGRVVAEGVAAAAAAGMIATMTRITTRTVQGGVDHAPAHRESVLVAVAVPTSLIAHLQAVLGAPGAPATLPGPVRHHVIVAARASPA